MKRENLRSILTEAGIENPSNLLISAILDAAKTDRDTAVADAVAATKKSMRVMYQLMTIRRFDGLNDLKNSQAKSRLVKLKKDLDIADKYLEYQ